VDGITHTQTYDLHLHTDWWMGSHIYRHMTCIYTLIGG